ncbi:type I secretion C-terminal target domain-containing protein, partial [Parahaliea maris]
FAVSVVDPQGDSDSDTLSVQIVDDVPTANDDTNSVNLVTPVSGNVVTENDVPGADGVSVVGVVTGDTNANYDDATSGLPVTVGAVIVGAYGTLSIAADGSYSYNRTAGPDEGGVQDVFTYTIRDGDGDLSNATLTIDVIDNEGPTVEEPAELADVPEFELRDDGMASRSETLQFTAGSTDIVSFAFSDNFVATLNGDTNGAAPDEIVWTKSPDGQTITGTINGEDAVVLTLTDLGGDQVEVEMTLLSPLANVLAGGNNILNLGTIEVIATDEAGLTATGVFDIGSIDDVPEVGDFLDPAPVANTAGATTGVLLNAGFLSGADGWSSIGLAGEPLEGVTYISETTGSGDTLVTTLTAVSSSDPSVEIFEVMVDASGQYSFTLITPEASTQQTISLTGLTPGGPIPFVETPGGLIEVNANGSGVNSSTPGSGVENNILDGTVDGVPEFLTFQFFDPGTVGDDTPTPANANLVDSVSFSNNHNGGTYQATVTNTLTGETSTFNGTVGKNAPIVISGVTDDVTNESFQFNEVTLTWVSGQMRITAATLSKIILPEGEDITFTVTGEDADGDVVMDDFTVVIDPALGSASSSAPASFGRLGFGTTEQSPVVEESGSQDEETDRLLATDGDDVFAFDLVDAQSDPDVTISGFGDSGSDRLDLRDLLQGEELEGADLTTYLNVTSDGVDTVIQVSSSGELKGNGGDANLVDQTITLEGIDLVTGHDDMASIIQNMLDSGKLTVDQ